jgi:CDP-diacylglycerol--serine O-phosphatidyltransferase
MKRNLMNRGKVSPIYLLPSIFTLGAMCCGFFAIYESLKGHFNHSAQLIFLAMIFDSLDGRVARLTHTSSPFGAELDSLSDMVNFGIAPAIIMYTWHLSALNKLGAIVTFIYAACAALRLARFNTMLGVVDKKFFIGLPSTASAPFVVGYVWMCHAYNLETPIFGIIGVLVTLFAAFSMVSNIKYYSFKEFNFQHRARFRVVVIFLLLMIFLIITPEFTIYGFFVLYAISGYIMLPIYKLYKKKHLKLIK